MDLLNPPPQEAPLDRRAAALFVDLGLRVLPFFALAGMGILSRDARLVSFAAPALALSVVVLALVDVVMLSLRGQTLGKCALGIYVGRRSGERASFLRLVLMRTLLPSVIMLLPYFGLLWVFLDHLWALGSERRAVHDLLADTSVFMRVRS